MASTNAEQMVVLVEQQNGEEGVSEWLQEEEDDEVECPECSSMFPVDGYFAHVHTVHRLFPCLYCFRNFGACKDLYVHLSSEHEVQAQSFSDGADYVDSGGGEASLLCVECDKVLESDSLEASIIIHKGECESSGSPFDEPSPAYENEISSPSCTPVTISEPIVRSPRKPVVTVENNFVASHLRNRSNACKHCGDKFSVSTIAAHVRACTGKSTNSASHGNSNQLRDMPPLRKPSTEVVTRTLPPKLTAAVPVKNQNGNAYPYRKNGLPALPKLQPAPTFRNRVVVEELPPEEPSPAVSPKYHFDEPSITSYLPSPLPMEHYEESDHFDLHQQHTPLAKSKSRKLSKSKRRSKSRSSKDEKASLQNASGITSSPTVPTKAEEFSLSVSAEVPEPSPPPSPLYLDPLLREQDDEKRLSLLVSELTEKLDMLSEHYPKSFKTYEVVFYETNKSDDWILNEMVRKSSMDCTYCKLVRLIKVDKRQLVIHLLSRHSWKISVIQPIRTAENPTTRLLDTDDIHVKPETDDIPVKPEVPEDDAISLTTSAATPQHAPQFAGTDHINGVSATFSEEQSSEGTTAAGQSEDPSAAADKTLAPPPTTPSSPERLNIQSEENLHSAYPEKLGERESEPLQGRPENETGDSQTMTMGSDSEVVNASVDTNGWTVSNSSETFVNIASKTDISDPPSDLVKHELLDTSIEDIPEVKAVNWIAFRFELLEKVFRSEHLVFTYSDSGDFGDRPCDCLICGQAAATQNSLFNHWKRAHPKVAMRCLLCKGRFLFAGALYCHLCVGTPKPLTLSLSDDENEEGVGDHTVGLRYECGICENGTLPGFFNLMVHFRRDHNKCELCLQSTEDQKDLEHHLKKHKLNHYCWKCNVSYQDKPSFMQHMIWKHGTESVNCSKCLQKKWPHVYHFCIPPDYFSCEVCGLNFTKAMSLRVHSRIHTGEKLKRCPKFSCGEKFISKKILQRHVESVHTKPQPPPAPEPEPEPTIHENDVNEYVRTREIESPEVKSAEVGDSTEHTEDTSAIDSVPVKDAISDEESNKLINEETALSSELRNDVLEPEKVEVSNGWPIDTDTVDNGNMSVGVTIEQPVEIPDTSNSVDISSPTKDDFNVNVDTGTTSEANPEDIVANESNSRTEVKPKPFNIAEIQGPNLSEDESDSSSDDEISIPAPAPTMNDNSVMDVDPDQEFGDATSPPDDLPVDVPVVCGTLTENLLEEKIALTQADVKLSDDEEEAMDVDVDTADSGTSGFLGNSGMNFQELSNGIADDFGLDSSLFAPQGNTRDNFGSYSPLLHSLDDFSVPDIPTFEENRLPDHIVQENALFSIQNEHDYSIFSTNMFGIKRKPLSPSYATGSYFNSPVQSRSPSPSRHRSEKKTSKSPKKRVRRHSSSSSSSSNSSCSSCGPDCSCSSSSSGSSSSSSSSSESEDDKRLTPVRKRRNSKQFSPYKSPRGPKLEINNEPPAPVEEPVKKKRGRKKKVVPQVIVEPEPEKEPEPVVNESELETDDSGSEEAFEKLQLTEVMTSRPPCDEIWEMQNEKYLLRLVRGVNTLEELRPPTPVPEEVHETKLMYKLKAPSQSKLKLRNIPIKPLIFKRSSLSGLATNGHSELSPSFMYNNVSELGPPSKKKKKSSSKKSNGKLKKSKKSIHTEPAYMGYNNLPMFNHHSSHYSPEKLSKKKKKRKKEAAEYDSVSFINPETYADSEVYCICQAPHDNVSEMIGCDSKDCRFKWFHFECVGISIAPKGKWYCPQCKERRRVKAAARIKMNGEDF